MVELHNGSKSERLGTEGDKKSHSILQLNDKVRYIRVRIYGYDRLTAI